MTPTSADSLLPNFPLPHELWKFIKDKTVKSIQLILVQENISVTKSDTCSGWYNEIQRRFLVIVTSIRHQCYISQLSQIYKKKKCCYCCSLWTVSLVVLKEITIVKFTSCTLQKILFIKTNLLYNTGRRLFL